MDTSCFSFFIICEMYGFQVKTSQTLHKVHNQVRILVVEISFPHGLTCEMSFYWRTCLVVMEIVKLRSGNIQHFFWNDSIDVVRRLKGIIWEISDDG